MPEDQVVLHRVLLGYIHTYNIICVYIDGLVTDNDLFDALLLVSKHIDVWIADVQLVLPLDEELGVLRVVLVHSQDEEAELFLILVGQDVEQAILCVIHDLLDDRDLVVLVNVDGDAGSEVHVDAVLR